MQVSLQEHLTENADYRGFKMNPGWLFYNNLNIKNLVIFPILHVY